MYFGRLISKRFNDRVILRATAPAPEGPWTIDPTPVFTGIDGGWNRETVPQSLAATDAGLVLAYDGIIGGGLVPGSVAAARRLSPFWVSTFWPSYQRVHCP